MCHSTGPGLRTVMIVFWPWYGQVRRQFDWHAIMTDLWMRARLSVPIKRKHTISPIEWWRELYLALEFNGWNWPNCILIILLTSSVAFLLKSMANGPYWILRDLREISNNISVALSLMPLYSPALIYRAFSADSVIWPFRNQTAIRRLAEGSI